jgi:hypothetical protein
MLYCQTDKSNNGKGYPLTLTCAISRVWNIVFSGPLSSRQRDPFSESEKPNDTHWYQVENHKTRQIAVFMAS